MGRKARFYRRIRETIISMSKKSSDRIISDCTMIAPLANDKGTLVSSKDTGKKRTLKFSGALHTKKSGKGNKAVKF